MGSHISITVTVMLVTLVEFKVLFMKDAVSNSAVQVGVALPHAALGALWAEFIDRDSYRKRIDYTMGRRACRCSYRFA